ncbi:hypothetical protein KKE26_11060, partial [bacterium]|nr:hypothetical protein [bacterium]
MRIKYSCLWKTQNGFGSGNRLFALTDESPLRTFMSSSLRALCPVLLRVFVILCLCGVVFPNISYAGFSIGLPGVIKERIEKLDQRITDQPLISRLTAEPTILVPCGTSTIICTAIDSNNDSLIYTWTANAGTITGNRSQVVWTAPLPSGTYSIICKVTDNKNRTDSRTVNVVVANQSPVINNLTANPTDVAPTGTSTITCTAYDPNGDTLTYTWTSGTGTILGNSSLLAWIAPQPVGTYTVSCQVSDNKGGIAQRDIQIVVVMGVNHLPRMDSLTANPAMLAPAGTSAIICNAYDSDVDALIYTWISDTGTILGTGSQVVWTSPLPSGTYSVSCEVSDGRGGISRGSVSVAVINQLPVINSLTANPEMLAPGGTSFITCTATDPNNDTFVYTWTSGTGTITGTNSQIVWTSPLSSGTYSVTCEVSDGKGGIAQRDVQVVVVMGANQPPVIGSLTAVPTTLAPGGTSTITCTATDPNGDPLGYTWTPDAGTILGTGSQVAWITPLPSGTYSVTCSVSDGKAGTSSNSVSVVVTNQPPVIGSL